MCWQDPDKHKEINALLGEVDSGKFADVVALGKMMTDYSVDAGVDDAGAGDILDNDIGVAVEFEGDDDDEDDDDVDELVVRGFSVTLCGGMLDVACWIWRC